jgi:uncharacterized membrane protein
MNEAKARNGRWKFLPRHSSNRIAAIDMVRGAAIIGVMIYHLCWDMRFLELVDWAVDTDPAWLIFARSLLGSFMLLTGMGLELGHADGFKVKPFWRRFGILVVCSAVITVATVIMFPDAYVYFGVLHAIALFSLFGVAFVRVRWWWVAGVAVLFIVPPVFIHLPLFNSRPMSVLGFWTVPPLTNDLVPVFPWFGFVLLGILIARGGKASGLWQKLATWSGGGLPGKGLAIAGRWSLFLYLAHQPALWAILLPLAGALNVEGRQLAAEFLPSCQQSCEIGGGETGYCTRYCNCALEQIETDNLWEAVRADPPTNEQSRQVNAVTQLCRAMAGNP